jgi:hypothetical protein
MAGSSLAQVFFVSATRSERAPATQDMLTFVVVYIAVAGRGQRRARLQRRTLTLFLGRGTGTTAATGRARNPAERERGQCGDGATDHLLDAVQAAEDERDAARQRCRRGGRRQREEGHDPRTTAPPRHGSGSETFNRRVFLCVASSRSPQPATTMEEDRLDWGHEDELGIVPRTVDMDDAEDAVSLGGDEEDEFLTSQSRAPHPPPKSRPPRPDPPPSAQTPATPRCPLRLRLRSCTPCRRSRCSLLCRSSIPLTRLSLKLQQWLVVPTVTRAMATPTTRCHPPGRSSIHATGAASTTTTSTPKSPPGLVLPHPPHWTLRCPPGMVNP